MNKLFRLPTLTTLRLVVLAMLIALAFVLGRFFSISIIPQQLVVSLSFIPNTLIGMIAGPIWSFIVLAIYDVVDNLSSGSGDFIIWFTLVEAVQGFFYGFFFYGKQLSWNRKKDWLYVSLATIVIMLIGTFIFNPLLMQIYFGTPLSVQFIAQGRLLKVFEIPFRIIVTMLILPQLQRIPEIRKLMGISSSK